MLFSTLLASGLVASVSALPTTKDVVVKRGEKAARTDIYIGVDSVMTGDQDPYWTYHGVYDLCGKTACTEGPGSGKSYTVKAPASGGVNHQAGEGTITLAAEGDWGNADESDWKERNALIEAIANAAKAAAAQKEYTLQVGPGCPPKNDGLNPNCEPKLVKTTYWEAPSWIKAVMLDAGGKEIGHMSVTVDFKAEQFDPLGIFSCDNAKSAIGVAIDAFEKSSPLGPVLGLGGDIFCAAVAP